MGVQIAKLTEKLELQQLVVSANTYGEPTEVWSTVRIIYGTQTTQKGKLLSNSVDQYSMDYQEFYCRYTPFDRKGTRVLYNGEPYKVWNVNHIPFREATIITLINYT